MATYKQAPLPFVGQKRMFLKQFETILEQNIEGKGEDWTIIDAFGGSGLLSHIAKCKKPLARVIYNDFDGYADRLKHIKETNQLRQDLLQIVGDIVPKNKRVDNHLKQKIINKINDFKGFKDLNSISSWLLFSGQQVGSFDELFERGFYNCIRQTDYPEAEDYLEGIEIVRESFHTLLPKFQHDSKTLFVLDPPYLCRSKWITGRVSKGLKGRLSRRHSITKCGMRIIWFINFRFKAPLNLLLKLRKFNKDRNSQF